MAGDTATYHILVNENPQAQKILKGLYEQKRYVGAALNAAVLAGTDGDTETRDKALAAVAGNAPYQGEMQLHEFALQAADSFKTGKPIDLGNVEALLASEQKTDNTNLLYFTGRVLILQGQKDRGIQYLKRAAGLNSHKWTRTLAAVYLRSIGNEPPKPGMMQ